MSWYDAALYHIQRLDETLPADMEFADRVKAVKEAYPWGVRRMHPYKMWLRAQKEYLNRHCPPTIDSKRFPLSPLERMIAKAAK